MMIRHSNIKIDRQERIIMHGWAAHQYANVEDNIRFKLMQHLILGGGMNTDQLFEKLYSEDPDGGPLAGTGTIQILFCQMKPVLTKLHLTLCRNRHNSRTYYWLAANEDVVRQTA